MDIYHQYRIFASEDGKEWTLVIDKSDSDKDCPHDYIELNEPLRARYLKYENVVDKSCRRQGIGRNALALLEEHCFRYLGIHQLFAYIAVENLPSRRLFAACGYKESAVLKEWAHTFGGGYTDVLVVQKLNLS